MRDLTEMDFLSPLMNEGVNRQLATIDGGVYHGAKQKCWWEVGNLFTMQSYEPIMQQLEEELCE